MLALDLLQPVTHRLQEVLVGLQDGAIEGELDDRLDPVQRRDLRLQLGTAIGRRLDAAAVLAVPARPAGRATATNGYAARPAPARPP
ncbi:Uncharacterised protein [Stenotrophomonas maltophilia]|nr:Uncharacterised protein [Stenotrophomonas maltophilia]